MSSALQTVQEMLGFTRAARKVWSETELTDFVVYIAGHATEGVLVEGTGGFRKVRWGIPGKGKRGGARVIYFFFSVGHPLILAAFYDKGERANLSQAEKNDLRKLAEDFKRQFRERQRRIDIARR